MDKIDVSNEGLRSVGINFQPGGFTHLAMLNALKENGAIDSDDHITLILFVLKSLGLLPDGELNADFPLDGIKYR